MSAAATPADVLAGTARWCVVEGDNSADMALEDGCVAAVLTDPPYNAKVHKGYKVSRWKGAEKTRHVDIGFDCIDPRVVAPELLRLSRGWALAFCALEQLGAYAESAGTRWVRGGIWHRPRAAPQFTGDRPAQAVDGIAIMHSRRAKQRWNGGGSHAFWSFGHRPEEEGANRGHPTRKPLLLMRELVHLFTDKDDVILDPFAGSGTTGVAALAEGRRVILCERVPEYAAITRARLAAAETGADWRAPASQPSLFAAVGS